MYQLYFWGLPDCNAQCLWSNNPDALILAHEALVQSGWKSFVLIHRPDRMPVPYDGHEQFYEEWKNFDG